jgi:hypothetical protein
LNRKILLRNESDEVEHFSVSHGFYLLTLNRSIRYRGIILRAGAGVVLSHPESRVWGNCSINTGDYSTLLFMPMIPSSMEMRIYYAALHAHAGIGYNFYEEIYSSSVQQISLSTHQSHSPDYSFFF